MIIRFATSFAAAVAATLCICAISPAQSYPPAWKPTATYAVGDQVQLNGNVYRCIHAVTTTDVPPNRYYEDWELNFVRSNTTLIIGPGQYWPTLKTAWSYIQNARVADGAYLHLYLSSANGKYDESFSTSFSLDHSSGAAISIMGDSISDTLAFPEGTNGLFVDAGHSFGGILQVTVSGSTSNNSSVGILAESSGNIGTVNDVFIEHFGTSVEAAQNGSVSVTNEGLLDFAVDAIRADFGGSVKFPSGGPYIYGANVLNSAGLHATNGGQIMGEGANISGCTWGAEATAGGIIDVRYSTISKCGTGCGAGLRGYIDCGSSTISSDGYYDVQVEDGGMISATDTSFASSNSDDTAGSYIVY